MKLIIVGGFLGAGKTTLLAEAARRLAAQGKRIGLVSNDQAPDLVDTALFAATGAAVEEIAGSCFCCNFNGFVGAVDSLVQGDADVVLAEPVGSCTDLAATIMRPLRRERGAYDLAPLTVLIDSDRAYEALGDKISTVDPDALYILRKQMEEADRLAVAKSDLLDEGSRNRLVERLAREFPDLPVRFVSSVSGEGVDEWLEEMLTTVSPANLAIEVDYDRYAHGEAVLGWLNASFRLAQNPTETQAREAATKLVALIGESARRDGLEIGHVKALISLGGQAVVANLTRLGGSIEARTVPTTVEAGLLFLNARVQTSPATMESIALEAIDQATSSLGGVERIALRTLSPGRPVPTYRLPVMA